MPTRPSPIASDSPPIPPPTIRILGDARCADLELFVPEAESGFLLEGLYCERTAGAVNLISFLREYNEARDMPLCCRYHRGRRQQLANLMHRRIERIATARVHPADARCTLTGKQTTSNPSAGKHSRLCSFSRCE